MADGSDAGVGVEDLEGAGGGGCGGVGGGGTGGGED